MEDQKRMMNAAELSDDQLVQAGGGLGTNINYLPQSDLVIGSQELSDDELDQVVGGYGIGDTVFCSHFNVEYCSNCGRLLKNFEATITGVRGVLNGQTIYFITRKCCGKNATIPETAILG